MPGVEKHEFEVSAPHDFHLMPWRRNDERVPYRITDAQPRSQFQSGHGSIRNFPKWMWVRGVSGVPLSQTARKSPGATSVRVGYEFFIPAS